jgi:hypothetical protein
MRLRSRNLFLGFGLMLALTMSARATTAQVCTLEYRRADNMWANWGRADGYLGAETITLQPGQKKVFATDWAYEKQRNDGTNFYGSHLRLAVNRGTVPVQLRLRGPDHFLKLVRSMVRDALSPLKPTTIAKGSVPGLHPGDTAQYRHDLAEVICPAAQATATAPPPEPPPPPVLLSLTGTPATPTTPTIAVTVAAEDVNTRAPLSGQVEINGVAGATGQPITFARCSETLEITDARGVTRTRTIRVPCEGTVKIAGYPDSHFTF